MARARNGFIAHDGVSKGYEGHHLIGVDEAKASKVMQRAAQLGYDINRRNNGAAFPSYGKNVGVTLDQGRAEALKEGLPLHKGEHADAVYTGCIRAILRKIENDYVAGLISDCDLCSVIKLWEDRILQALLDHKIWLNKYDSHIKTGQKGASPTT